MPAVAVTHEDTGATITQTKWNKNHQFAGGQAGTVLTWDATSATKASWKAAIGLNTATPTVDGTISGVLGSTNGTAITWKLAASANGGAFVDLQTNAGVVRFKVAHTGALTVNRNAVAPPAAPALVTPVAQFAAADGALAGTVIDAFGSFGVY